MQLHEVSCMLPNAFLVFPKVNLPQKTQVIAAVSGAPICPGIETLTTATFHDHGNVVIGCVSAYTAAVEALLSPRRAVEMVAERGFCPM